MKDDFKDRLECLDDFCKEAINVVERSMGRVEILAKDNVNEKESALRNMFELEIGGVRDLMSEMKKENEEERAETLQINSK